MRRFVASLTFTAVTAASLLALSGTANAQDEPERAGDPRAVYVAGNATGKDCATLWPGSKVVKAVENNDESLKYITITEADVPDGITLVGVVVKASNGYNKYSAEALGEMPWEDLHGPFPAGNSKEPATISHWFTCGVKKTTTTTVTTTTDATTTTTTATSDVTTTTTTTTTVGNTTTTVAPGTGGDNDLPDTGANVGWMIFLGAALLLSGGLLMGVPRIRNAVLRRD